MPCEDRVPASRTEAPVSGDEHISSFDLRGETAEQEHIVPRADGHTTHNGCVSFRITGSLDLGKKQAASAMESGLRRVCIGLAHNLKKAVRQFGAFSIPPESSHVERPVAAPSG